MKINEYLTSNILKNNNKKKEFIELEREFLTKYYKSNKYREIIYDIIKSKNLDGLLLSLTKKVIKIEKSKYIKFPNSQELFEELIKTLENYSKLNFSLSDNEMNEINKSVDNFEKISAKFLDYLGKKTPKKKNINN